MVSALNRPVGPSRRQDRTDYRRESVFFQVYGRTRADGGRTGRPTGPGRALFNFAVTFLQLVYSQT